MHSPSLDRLQGPILDPILLYFASMFILQVSIWRAKPREYIKSLHWGHCILGAWGSEGCSFWVDGMGALLGS